MRPLLVLSLVVVAVAVLLFALFTGDGNTDSLEVAVVEPPAPEAFVAPERRAEVAQPDSTPLQTGEDALRAPVADGRQSVGAASESFDNSLVGQILDPEGLPVENARLVLTEGGMQEGMLELQRVLGRVSDKNRKSRNTRSDEDGRYRFRNLEPGNYSLVSEHEEFSPHNDPMIPIPFMGETVWDVKLEEGLVLHGYVHDFEGQPIEGAVLSLTSSMTPALFAPSGTRDIDSGTVAKTDETGYFRYLNIAPGASWHLSASATGFGTQSRRNLRISAKNGTNNFDFRLEPGEKVSGMVYAPDRSPIVGARVQVLGYQQPQTLKASTTTDQTGRFTIPELVSGNYVLIVDAEGWGRARENRIEAPASGLELEMTEQGSVMGMVVDLSGNTVTNYTVSLHQYIAQTATYGRHMQEKKIDSTDGSFTLTGVTAGQFGVKIFAPGFAETYSEDFEVIQGLVTTDVLVRMSQGGLIGGIVVDAGTGEPVAGATISTQDNNFQDNPLMRMFRTTMPRKTTAQEARSGKDGRFELALLSPELYQIQVTHPRYPTVYVNDMRVMEGKLTEMGRIRLQPGSTVRGTVYDSAGEPLAGATVQLVSTQPGVMLHHEGRTGSAGRYILRLVPEGSYNLTATRPSQDDEIFGQIVDMKNSKILFKVARGQEYSQDLYLGGGR